MPTLYLGQRVLFHHKFNISIVSLTHKKSIIVNTMNLEIVSIKVKRY